MGCLMSGIKQYLIDIQVEFLRRLVTAGDMTSFLNRAVGNCAAPPVKAGIRVY